MLIVIWNARLGLSPFTRYTLYYAMSNFGDVSESRQMKEQGLGHVDVTLPHHLVEESFIMWSVLVYYVYIYWLYERRFDPSYIVLFSYLLFVVVE
jgi:hypothetical protein